MCEDMMCFVRFRLRSLVLVPLRQSIVAMLKIFLWSTSWSVLNPHIHVRCLLCEIPAAGDRHAQ